MSGWEGKGWGGGEGGEGGPQNRLPAAPAPKVALCSKHSSIEPTGSKGAMVSHETWLSFVLCYNVCLPPRQAHLVHWCYENE